MAAYPELPAGESARWLEPVKCDCGENVAQVQAINHHLRTSLEIALQYYQAIMESVFDGVVILGPDHQIKQANASAEAMFDADPGELLGKRLWSFLADESDQSSDLHLDVGKEWPKPPEAVELWFISVAGRPFYAEVLFNYFVLEDIILQVIVLRNVDEYIQKVNALADHRRQIQELYARQISTQEEERKRIFRDLHDEVGQRITALRFGINRMIGEIESPPEELSGAIKHQITEISQAVRSLSADLQSVGLQYAGLWDAFENLAKELHAAAGLKVALNFEGLRREQRFDPELELAVYRITQESLNNALKYAGVEEVGVLLALRDAHLLVSIWDEGAGFAPGRADQEKGGTGIPGMKERAAMLGGKLQVSSIPGEGTTIRAEFPIGLQEQVREENCEYDEDFDRR